MRREKDFPFRLKCGARKSHPKSIVTDHCLDLRNVCTSLGLATPDGHKKIDNGGSGTNAFLSAARAEAASLTLSASLCLLRGTEPFFVKAN
jgi:hypothetical protein